MTPPGFASRTWDGLDLDSKALLLAYEQIRDTEEKDELAAILQVPRLKF